MQLDIIRVVVVTGRGSDHISITCRGEPTMPVYYKGEYTEAAANTGADWVRLVLKVEPEIVNTRT